MARIAVSDGITVMACTPHIMPGVFDNCGPDILAAIERLQAELVQAGLPLKLVAGADVHMAPDLPAALRDGRALSLAGSRYFLFEPPQKILPPRFEVYLFSLVSAGLVPLLTHPERSGWLEANYEMIRRAAHRGVWMQITSGSLTGRFGRRAKYWAERMLDDGIVHVLATDAHDTERRPPLLSEGVEAAAQRIGEEQALRLVTTRPACILENAAPGSVPAPGGAEKPVGPAGIWTRAKRMWG